MDRWFQMGPSLANYVQMPDISSMSNAEIQESNEERMRELFVKWWTDSYGRPPMNHATMTHVAFAIFAVKDFAAFTIERQKEN